MFWMIFSPPHSLSSLSKKCVETTKTLNMKAASSFKVLVTLCQYNGIIFVKTWNLQIKT